MPVPKLTFFGLYNLQRQVGSGTIGPANGVLVVSESSLSRTLLKVLILTLVGSDPVGAEV